MYYRIPISAASEGVGNFSFEYIPNPAHQREMAIEYLTRAARLGHLEAKIKLNELTQNRTDMM